MKKENNFYLWCATHSTNLIIIFLIRIKKKKQAKWIPSQIRCDNGFGPTILMNIIEYKKIGILGSQ